MSRTPDLAIMLFDLSITGVVRNAIRIAAKAHEAGLATEIWVVQDRGPGRADVPEGVPVVGFGKDIGDLYSRRQRKAASPSSPSSAATCANMLCAFSGPKDRGVEYRSDSA